MWFRFLCSHSQSLVSPPKLSEFLSLETIPFLVFIVCFFWTCCVSIITLWLIDYLYQKEFDRNNEQSVSVSLPLSSPVAQKVVAMRKKQQLSIGPCKSLPNSPSHSSVPTASIPSVHINQVRSQKTARCFTYSSCSYFNIDKCFILSRKEGSNTLRFCNLITTADIKNTSLIIKTMYTSTVS